MQRGFGSDNHSGVHPQLLESMLQANSAHAPSYGTDEWSEKAQALLQKHFGAGTKSFFVFNGTAANVLSLRALMKPYQSVFCSDVSHLHLDECAAPEFFTGGKLIIVPSENGKMRLSDLKRQLIRRGDQHFAQTKVLSLTQPTELGTVYSLNEIQELTSWAHSQQMLVHMDGARLANACVRLGVSFKQMTTELGVDVVSLGGTKNGLMMGEAVVFLKASLSEDFQYIRKQSAQLPSKTRFISAPFCTYLEGSLWQEIAAHSLAMAQYLHQSVKDIGGVEVTQPVESNAVFAKIPQAWVAPMKKVRYFYVWDETTFECRWMTSWDTQKEDIDDFAAELKKLSLSKNT
jgi:threonine aldolase